MVLFDLVYYYGAHSRPLQPVTLQKPSSCDYQQCAAAMAYDSSRDESSFIPYHDSSTSLIKPYDHKILQPLKSSIGGGLSQSSFSVYEDSNNESSFMPYHDSMHASSSFRKPPVLQDVAVPVYSAPLGVPLVHSEHSISEQTFTQFDIGHPNEFEPVSTPKFVHRKGTLFI